MNNIFYTAKELAEILKIDHRKVKRLIHSGRIRAVNLGTDIRPLWRIYDGELKRFIAENYEKYSKNNKNSE